MEPATRLWRPFPVRPFLSTYSTAQLAKFMRSYLDDPFAGKFAKYAETIGMSGSDFVAIEDDALLRLCNNQPDAYLDLKTWKAALRKPQTPRIHDIFDLPSITPLVSSVSTLPQSDDASASDVNSEWDIGDKNLLTTPSSRRSSISGDEDDEQGPWSPVSEAHHVDVVEGASQGVYSPIISRVPTCFQDAVVESKSPFAVFPEVEEEHPEHGSGYDMPILSRRSSTASLQSNIGVLNFEALSRSDQLPKRPATDLSGPLNTAGHFHQATTPTNEGEPLPPTISKASPATRANLVECEASPFPPSVEAEGGPITPALGGNKSTTPSLPVPSVEDEERSGSVLNRARVRGGAVSDESHPNLDDAPISQTIYHNSISEDPVKRPMHDIVPTSLQLDEATAFFSETIGHGDYTTDKPPAQAEVSIIPSAQQAYNCWSDLSSLATPVTPSIPLSPSLPTNSLGRELDPASVDVLNHRSPLNRSLQVDDAGGASIDLVTYDGAHAIPPLTSIDIQTQQAGPLDGRPIEHEGDPAPDGLPSRSIEEISGAEDDLFSSDFNTSLSNGDSDVDSPSDPSTPVILNSDFETEEGAHETEESDSELDLGGELTSPTPSTLTPLSCSDDLRLSSDEDEGGNVDPMNEGASHLAEELQGAKAGDQDPARRMVGAFDDQVFPDPIDEGAPEEIEDIASLYSLPESTVNLGEGQRYHAAPETTGPLSPPHSDEIAMSGLSTVMELKNFDSEIPSPSPSLFSKKLAEAWMSSQVFTNGCLGLSVSPEMMIIQTPITSTLDFAHIHLPQTPEPHSEVAMEEDSVSSTLELVYEEGPVGPEGDSDQGPVRTSRPRPRLVIDISHDSLLEDEHLSSLMSAVGLLHTLGRPAIEVTTPSSRSTTIPTFSLKSDSGWRSNTSLGRGVLPFSGYPHPRYLPSPHMVAVDEKRATAEGKKDPESVKELVSACGPSSHQLTDSGDASNNKDWNVSEGDVVWQPVEPYTLSMPTQRSEPGSPLMNRVKNLFRTLLTPIEPPPAYHWPLPSPSPSPHEETNAYTGLNLNAANFSRVIGLPVTPPSTSALEHHRAQFFRESREIP